jgi:coproporphyrinogen III oxidase-like Fe-S oxidoreductase
MYNEYCNKLTEEVSIIKNKSNSVQVMKNIESIYFGGGTPSLLNYEQMNNVLNMFRSGINENTEITV